MNAKQRRAHNREVARAKKRLDVQLGVWQQYDSGGFKNADGDLVYRSWNASSPKPWVRSNDHFCRRYTTLAEALDASE